MGSDKVDLFRKVCGALSPLVIDIQGDGATHRARRIFHQSFVTCGKHPDADLRLSDPRVSLSHYYFQVIGGRILAIDLSCEQNLSIGDSGRPWAWLDASSEVRVGGATLRLQGGSTFGEGGRPGLEAGQGSPFQRLTAPEAGSPGAEVLLEAEAPGSEGFTWQMGSVLALVGQSERCQLRLRSKQIAPIHCALLRTEVGVWVVDLLSTNGIKANGCACKLAHLVDGTELSLGPFRFRIRYGTAQTHPLLGHGTRADVADDGWDVAVENRGSQLAPSLQDQLVLDNELSILPFDESDSTTSEALRDLKSLARILGAMYQDQWAAFREEREELDQLADELRAMKAELIDSRVTSDSALFHRLWNGTDDIAESFTSKSFDAFTAWLLKEPETRTSPVESSADVRTTAAPGSPTSSAFVTAANRPTPRELHVIADRLLSLYRPDRSSLKARLVHLWNGTVEQAGSSTRST